MTDKILKALEGLKHLRLSSVMDSSALKKEKMAMCVQLADQIASLRLRAQSMPELTSRAVESLIHLCDDAEADVRAVADESLNRVIRVLSETHALQVQVELYKQVKKNGAARCVRTALSKFTALIGRMRPSKRRAFAAQFTPCVLALAPRPEESVLETLAKSLDRIWPVLGPFMHDSETKNLLKAFLLNLSSENAVIRRCSASSVATIAAHSRKPQVFTSFALNALMDKVIPVSGETSAYLLLGTFSCVRALLPLLNEQSSPSSEDSSLYTDKLLQIYELCLHYAGHRDHNVVTGSLETLNQLLTSPSRQLKAALLHPGGITRSYIHSVRQPSRQWGRSVSEISVAASLTAGEESLLDEGDIPFQSLGMPEQTAWSINRLRSLSASAAPEDDLDSDLESVTSEAPHPPPSLSLVLRDEERGELDVDREEESSRSREDLLSLAPSELDKELDVGSFTDGALPLLFCCRRLSVFLLDGSPGGLRSDRSSRVSVKSIALSCLSAVLQLCPQLLSVKLTPFSDCEQRVSDVLLLSEHSDPQLRGVACVLIGSFLSSSLVESRGRTVPSLDDASSPLYIQTLLDILDKGLRDNSPATSRLALSAVRSCMTSLLSSDYCGVTIPLLRSLPSMAPKAYWLNKVRLVELLSELDFVIIGDVTGSVGIQDDVTDNVLLPLLSDMDGRVRRAAAEAISKIIPKLWTSESAHVAFTDRFAREISEVLRCSGQNRNFSALHLPPSYSHLHDPAGPNGLVMVALSKIVARLTKLLALSDDKYQMFGILETLRLLSEQYPPVVYMTSWHCHRQADAGASCLLPLLSSLVTSCPYLSDLGALENATALVANLYAGHAVCAMKTNSLEVTGGSSSARWPIFGNDEMGRISDDVLTHLMTVLNVYTQLQEAPPPLRTNQGRLLHLLPNKKGEREESAHLLNPHYGRLQQALKSAYANHKMCLEDSASEKFLSLLSSTLFGLSSLLEMSLSVDSSRIAEEVLSYMRALVSLQPEPVFTVVLQLLRSLFAVTLPHYWSGLPEDPPKSTNSLYANVFQAPEDLIAERIRRHTGSSSDEKGASSASSGNQRKLLHLNPDRTKLVTHVRLFEPMVVKALQLYTVTGDVGLQCLILTLVVQLLEVTVNYCLLDAQLTFLGFVKKQFELIERGQMKGVERLLPRIFRFFVCLSYEEQHSKPPMSIPDILQLFVGLRACDQPKETHCVPGLWPVVADVFLPRQKLGDDRKEADTQREVLLDTLLRLAMHTQVLDALCFVLRSHIQVGGQVAAAVLPLVAEGQIMLEEVSCRRSFGNVFNLIPVSVFTPPDALLKALFLEPRDRNGVKEMARWVAVEALLLEVILCLKEDTVLSRIQPLIHPVDLDAFLAPPATAPDPLLVAPPSASLPPAQSLARLLLLTISRAAVLILDSPHDADVLESALTEFFVPVFHLLQSGTFRRTANELETLLQTNNTLTTGIMELFMQLGGTRPVLTCQYLNLMGLLMVADPRVWAPPLKPRPASFPLRMVRRGAVLALADYICESPWDTKTMELLVNSSRELLDLYEEAPVRELLTLGAQRPQVGPILLQVITAMNISSPRLVERALRILATIHSEHSGAVARLLVAKFLRLPFVALSRVASELACRRLEYLLLLPHAQVLSQLPFDAFRELRLGIEDSVTKQRHASLANLISKIGKTVYQEPEIVTVSETRPLQTAPLSFTEKWFYTQVKQRCCRDSNPGCDVGPLLLKLSYPLLKELFAQPDFQPFILAECFRAVRLDVDQARGKQNLNDIPLYVAARESLLERVREVVSGLPSLDGVPDPVWSLAPILTAFLNLLPSMEPSGLSLDEMAAFIEFSLHCLQKIAGAVTSAGGPPPTPSATEAALSCARALLVQREAQLWLSQSEHRTALDSALCACVTLVRALLPHFQQRVDMGSTEAMVEYLLTFLLMSDVELPEYLEGVLRRTVVLLCRLPPLWTMAVSVPEAIDVEPDTLHGLSVRVAALGWTSRAQFEEVWAALLGGFSLDNTDPALSQQTGAAALEGISVLMAGTLLSLCGDPGSELTHHSRDVTMLRECALGAPRLDPCDGFHKDLEAVTQSDRYRPGLLSVEYLWSATQLACPSPDVTGSADSTSRHQDSALGLDLTSCLHFLLDLYSQWSTELKDERFMAAALKTSLVLSDQFTDPSQFRSLLNVALAIDRVFAPTDVPLLPLCILVTAKCLAALLPGGEQYDRLKEMMCRSDGPSVRLATLQALLYLVQSPVVYWRLQPSRQLGNSMFYVEDNEAVTQLVGTFLPLAVEILLQFIVDRCSWSETYEAHAWALLVYLLQHYRSELGEHREELIQLLLTSLSTHKGSQAILHGVERLLLADCLDESHVTKVGSTALLLIGQPFTSARRHGYQLLLTASFISKRRVSPIALGADGLTAAMERLALLLSRLRRAAPREAADTSHALRYLLKDMQPIEVLTKLIQEFLSPHHPYTHMLASLLFQVMEDADLALIQDWVVFSLPSLVHGVPAVTGTRTLTCLFLSASRDPWLRSVFPLTQEPQQPHLLAAAASHFYSQLKLAKQQEEFRKVFEKASKVCPVYAQILNNIS